LSVSEGYEGRPFRERLRRIRSDKYLLLALVASLAYSLTWTAITLLRIYGFRASVYDLGVFAQEGWRTYSVPTSLSAFVLAFFNQGGGLYLFPLILGGYPVILAVQSTALGFGGLITYLIARRLSVSPPRALGLAAAYLLYFPLYGVNWDDAHYEAFLVPLFLLGVWLLLRGNYRLSLLAMALIAPLQYPVAAFPLFFSVQLLVPAGAGWLLLQLRSAEGRPTEPEKPSLGRRTLTAVSRWSLRTGPPPLPRWYAPTLFVVSGAILAGGFFTNRLFYPENGLLTLAHATSLNPGLNVQLKLFSILLLLAPLAFLPLLSPRWLQFCVPFLFLMVFANYYGFTYPGIVISWYPCLILPFLALAAVDAVAKIEAGTSWAQSLWRRVRSLRRTAAPARSSAAPAAIALPPRRWRRAAEPGNAAVIAIAIGVIASSTFLAPYGPWNSSTSANFALGELLDYNATLYEHFTRLADLIPRNAVAVILQDNMPTLLPRPLPPGDQSPLVAGPSDVVAYNLTWANPNGSWTPIDPQYVIGNPTPLLYSFFNASGDYPFNTSMQDILYDLYQSGQYGIVGEADGMIVLERGYDGPIQYYEPYVQSFPASSFLSRYAVRNSPNCDAPCLSVSNLRKNQIAWYGPYTYLSPGNYTVTYHVVIQNWSALDNATLQVTSDYAGKTLGEARITGPYAGTPSMSMNVSIPIIVSNGAPGIEFRSVGSLFAGTLVLYSVSIVQTGPPTTVYS
jgi:uncharacterized membrane protein